MTPDSPAHYQQHGHMIARALFTPREIAEMKAAADRIKQHAAAHPTPAQTGNIRYVVEQDPNVGTNVRAVSWPAHLEPALEAARTHPNVFALIQPLLGNAIKQLTCQLHFKTPGSRMVVQFHTDRQNRVINQRNDLRDMHRAFCQTAVAIDPMTECNGALRVIPGSHRRPDALGTVDDIYSQQDLADDRLADAQFNGDDAIPLLADPGDVVAWHPDLIHGSGLNNHPTLDRCLYINGYVNAHDCFRGQWAWLDAQPVPLPNENIPVLINGDPSFDHYPLDV